MKMDSPIGRDAFPFSLSPQKQVELPQILISKDVLFSGKGQKAGFGSEDLNLVPKCPSNPLSTQFKFSQSPVEVKCAELGSPE